MVKFKNDGQGYWDFDFTALVELTSVEFLERVQEEISWYERRNDEILAFDVSDMNIFVRFTFMTKYTIISLDYSKKLRSIDVYRMGTATAETILRKAGQIK